MKQQLSKTMQCWAYIAPLVAYPNSKKEFDALVERLDFLLDEVGDNEDHPLMGLVDLMSEVIFSYEEKHSVTKMGKGLDALKFLMQANQLSQSDLSEIGSQGVLSEILSDKRSLNVRQIKLLAKRFHVDPGTFID